MKTRDFLSQVEKERVIQAIRDAEARTSGEIRVCIERGQPQRDDPVAEAEFHFQEIGMTMTRERNGVLIYVAPVPQKFAIVGDHGITSKCGEAYWNELVIVMREEFRAGHFTEALVLAIQRVGSALAEHFCRRCDDINELPDQILES